MTRPTVVILCEHGEAKPHRVLVRGPDMALDPPDYESIYQDCSGGRVLEQAIIIERDTLARYLQMTAPPLRVSCVHGKWEAHGWINGPHCPGGREPTVEETTQWLKERATLQRGLDDLNEGRVTDFKPRSQR